jgi:SpoVK/Ycf46/Vps4 family AAA+-type ATPase
MDFNQENYILNEKIYNELLTEITRFKNKNIQRSYMLVGPAGTGKSTFCLELSKRISGKIVKLDSNTFNNLDDSMTKNLIENLECDFIIVDDIDRISYAQNTARFLYMLEYMKEFKTKPTLLVTVNNILELDKAVLRPGRFDDIIEFNYPTKNERKDFIAKYFIKLNKNVSQDHINAIANVTNGMTQAYLKEYCFQYIIENNIQKLITKIKKRKKFVEMSNIKCVSDNDMKELLMKDNSQINAKTLRGVARLK